MSLSLPKIATANSGQLSSLMGIPPRCRGILLVSVYYSFFYYFLLEDQYVKTNFKWITCFTIQFPIEINRIEVTWLSAGIF